jgi:hypothetical protein
MTKPLSEILAPLVAIADAYDANNLDDEARKFWGATDQHENTTPPEQIELYTGRGGRRLLTLADCLAARELVREAAKAKPVQIDLSAAGDTPPLKFTYTNWKGVTAERTVTPQRLFYGEQPHHDGPQWFLHAFCHDRRAPRTFAFNDIRKPVGALIPPDIHERVLAVGKVVWSATDPKDDKLHLADLARCIEGTRENYDIPASQPLQMHMLALESDDTTLLGTIGVSPNSGQHARILAGAWNRLVDECTSAAPVTAPDLAEAVGPLK